MHIITHKQDEWGKSLSSLFQLLLLKWGKGPEKGSKDSCLTIELDVYLSGPLRRRGPGTPQAKQPVAAGELIDIYLISRLSLTI